MPDAFSIAYFVSPHGYGHAARSAAVMQAITDRAPTQFEIFTKVPKCFFDASLRTPFGYHDVLTDIGLAQDTALQQNLPETVRRLNDFMPFDDALVDALAGQVQEANCQAVICDISPLGIVVARRAGLPVVLIENFTWDWIYSGYAQTHPQLDRHIAYLQDLFASVDVHIQTQPACDVHSAADLLAAPVCRSPRTDREVIRAQLQVTPEEQVVVVTMGGIPWSYGDLSELMSHSSCVFVVPASGERVSRQGNLISLPHHSEFYHPDLVFAADAVVGKVGYSTIAEVYRAGVPFGYIARPDFPESPPLIAFIEQEMAGLNIASQQFADGSWIHRVEALTRLTRRNASELEVNGADQIAELLLRSLGISEDTTTAAVQP